jgi:elongation factor Ts
MDINKLKELREKTGVSYSICQKALKEANGDIIQAEKLLIQWGAEKITEKKDKQTVNGCIFTYLHHNKQVASMVEILCETDFVSQNPQFQTMGYEIAMQIASLQPKDEKELLDQPFIKDQSKTINDILNEAVLKFGEKIKINRFIYWYIGQVNK